MSATRGGYDRSRFNSVTFGTHVSGPLPCPGPPRCKFEYCGGCQPPLVGNPCIQESEHAAQLESAFRERWGLLTITPDTDDFEHLVREAVDIDLQRTRTMSKLNRSTTMLESHGAWNKAVREAKLADLYLDRLARRQARLEAELQAGLERMSERAERYGQVMPVIEYLLAAKAQRETPSQPVWDDFADSETHLAPPC